MKLQIDFDNKTIKLEEKVNLGELFNQLEEILPDLKWREFELEMGSITNHLNLSTIAYDLKGDPKFLELDDEMYNIDVT